MTSPDVIQTEMPVENQNPLTTSGEVFHNFAGRIGSSLRNGYEAICEVPGNIRTYTAIGASAVTLFTLANAESAVASPDPFASENVPTLTGATALAGVPEAGISTASGNLEQKCATDIFTQPQILDNDMHNPGQKYQDFFVKLGFGPVDTACYGQFKRLAAVKFQLKRHGHIINSEPVWDPYLSTGNTNLVASPGVVEVNSHSNPKLYYQPGDKVQFALRLQELDLTAKKVVKTDITTYPVTVHRN